MRPALTRHLPEIVPFAHGLLQRALQPGDIAIDATAGNGHDTLLLAQQVLQEPLARQAQGLQVVPLLQPAQALLPFLEQL